MENSTSKRVKMFIALGIMLFFFWKAYGRFNVRDFDAGLVYSLGGFVFAIVFVYAAIIFVQKEKK